MALYSFSERNPSLRADDKLSGKREIVSTTSAIETATSQGKAMKLLAIGVLAIIAVLLFTRCNAPTVTASDDLDDPTFAGFEHVDAQAGYEFVDAQEQLERLCDATLQLNGLLTMDRCFTVPDDGKWNGEQSEAGAEVTRWILQCRESRGG